MKTEFLHGKRFIPVLLATGLSVAVACAPDQEAKTTPTSAPETPTPIAYIVPTIRPAVQPTQIFAKPESKPSREPSPDFVQADMLSLLNKTLRPKFMPEDTTMPTMLEAEPPPFNTRVHIHSVESMQGDKTGSPFQLSTSLLYRELGNDTHLPIFVIVAISIPTTYDNLDPEKALELWKELFRISPTKGFKCETPNVCETREQVGALVENSFRIESARGKPPFPNGTNFIYAEISRLL